MSNIFDLQPQRRYAYTAYNELCEKAPPGVACLLYDEGIVDTRAGTSRGFQLKLNFTDGKGE